jgi:hypothetical protein
MAGPVGGIYEIFTNRLPIFRFIFHAFSIMSPVGKLCTYGRFVSPKPGANLQPPIFSPGGGKIIR